MSDEQDGRGCGGEAVDAAVDESEAWTRAFSTQEICARVQRAVQDAWREAMQAEGLTGELLERVLTRVRASLHETGDAELWAAQLPHSLGLEKAGDVVSADAGVVLDAFSLMQFRLVVPSWRSGDQLAQAAAQAITHVHTALMKQSGHCARSQVEAQQAGDNATAAAMRRRAEELRHAAALFQEDLWAESELDLFEQVQFADRGASELPFDYDLTEAERDRWTQVPAFPLPDLPDESAFPRHVLISMIEQVRTVREHLTGMAVRYGSSAAPQEAERHALARATAMTADLIDAALAAGARRSDELSRHIAAHGRQLDRVI
ncbi:hypothetical protein [Actinomadura flavalba]|uniref:hypothetical protein n=1 Tax=Actinomadura flavalba TaxID=1120938 RepID=UPI00036918A5|nr:hypothetical protein [Actinomadura flavalba]